jgi:2'-5' RNA ligase
VPGRCFIAVDLPPKTVRLLGAACSSLVEAAPAWAGEKWTRAENLHITLIFIGSVPHAAVGDVLADAARACAVHASFDLSLAGVRAVPSRGRARMLWATFQGQVAESSRLARDLGRTLERRLGLDAPDRAFVPHVTLARARDHRVTPGEALIAAEEHIASGKPGDRTVSVRSVTLYSSTLRPDGPVYEPLGSVSLDGWGDALPTD